MPQIALTDTYVRAAKAEAGKRLEVTDARCPGLALRVTDAGIKTWAHKYWSRTQQKPVRITLGQFPALSLADARSRVHAATAQIANGDDPHAVRAAEVAKAKGALTFDELAERYIDGYARLQKASWQTDVSLLKRPRAKWRNRAARSITDDDVAALLDEIAITAPASANRTQATIHKLFAWAREPGRRFVDANPIAGMRRRAKETPKDRVLSDDEIRALWIGLDDPELPAARPLALALKMILLTMARPGEVAGMERAELRQLESDRPEWHLASERTKNRRAHIVPLSAMAVSVIREAMPDDQPVVFRSKFSSRATVARHSLSQALIEIRTYLKMAEPFTPHDLRRTAATLARSAGARRDALSALLNHTPGDITGVYDRYDLLAEKREVVNILKAQIVRIIGATGSRRPAKRAPRRRTTPADAAQ